MSASSIAAVRQLFPSTLRLLEPADFTPVVEAEAWCFPQVQGRLVELSGQGAMATLCMAMQLVADAQRRGEHVAWITATPSGTHFYPPDAARSGVDLNALVIVRTTHAASGRRTPVQTAGRAATHLLRSGAFGLVVFDLGAEAAMPIPLQSRLVGLAQHHGSAVVCVTSKSRESPSLGSLVSLRGEARRERLLGGGMRVSFEVIKDKRRGPGFRRVEECDGPAGLC